MLALLTAEFGAFFAPPDGRPLAGIDGDGEEVEELMPLVWMPGGMGRFAFAVSDCTVVAEGAIFANPRGVNQRDPKRLGSVPLSDRRAALLRYR